MRPSLHHICEFRSRHYCSSRTYGLGICPHTARFPFARLGRQWKLKMAPHPPHQYLDNCDQPKVAGVPLTYGDLSALHHKELEFLDYGAQLCKPDNIHICDGSETESKILIETLKEQGIIYALPKYENCWLARTDPADVARVESKTFISTPNKRDSVPIPKEGVKGQLGNWMSPPELEAAIDERFPGCMKGRTMYLLGYSMGPIGSPLSKIGIQITDSPYVVLCMRIMTRMGRRVLDVLGDDDFIRCLHSVGAPLPLQRPLINNWPCNPEKIIVAHKTLTNDIISYGSGYGGNSLLGKKCFSLRIGSAIGRREGWLAEHMLIVGITNPAGQKKYIAAAFPSACGKTNLAMLTPSLPGYKVECVGDDIAWMHFDQQGKLRAINPENGFFGVCPGTSPHTNAVAMDMITKNTVFTNVGQTSDGGVFWEGMESELAPGVTITSWLGEENWTPQSGHPAAHPNSRFCCPARQCPIMDPAWEDPQGVPIDAILFGGRRPKGVPLIYESFSWKHGVFVGASVSSEATAAAEYKSGTVMHDPFSARPFLSYNAGQYFAHWLRMEQAERQMPKIFHVNWFLRDTQGHYLWPGYGDNIRVLDWIMRRCDGEDIAQSSPVGLIPKPGTIPLEGLEGFDKSVEDQLFSLPKDFWLAEVKSVEQYFDEQIGEDLPQDIRDEIQALKDRINAMP